MDRALGLLAEAERARVEAAELLAGLAGTGMAEWLGYVSWDRLVAHRTGCGNQAAREVMRVARHLDRFPVTALALRGGGMSWAQAEALARAASGLDHAYAADEAELLDTAEAQSVEGFEATCRLWRARADAEANAADAERVFDRRSLTMQLAFDGSSHGRFSLDAVGTEIVATALESSPDPAHTLPEPRTARQRRADKLVDVCLASLTQAPVAPEEADTDGEVDGNGNGNTGDRNVRARVDVVIDVETLAGTGGPIDRMRAELAHGGPITGPGLNRILCDASFRALITDGPDVVLRYNRATPAIPPALRRAVQLRDRGCTFTGCDRPVQWCDLHHIVPRNRGGPTTIENLTLLCRHHHGTVHDGGWHLSRAPDGTIAVSSP